MFEMVNIVRKKWKIYETICDEQEITIYELSKIVGWSLGKIKRYIKKLLKDGLINSSTEIIGKEKIKRYSPKKVGELINWKEMKHTKKF